MNGYLNGLVFELAASSALTLFLKKVKAKKFEKI